MLKLLKSKRVLLIAVIVTLLGWAGITVAERDVANVVNLVLEEKEKPDETTAVTKRTETEETAPSSSTTENFNEAVRISPERRAHILYGDATGGGHKFGIGAPCKSEFPEHWDDDTIIKEVELIASNDNLSWEQQRNGYYVTEQKIGTVKVRVVKGRNAKDIITAYPTNLKRNPCPSQGSPANDN